MDVNRDRSGHKTKIRAGKWTAYLARIPTMIQSTIGHRIRIGKQSGRMLVYNWDTDFMKLSGNFGEPFITGCKTGGFVFCGIQISATPESVSLGCNTI